MLFPTAADSGPVQLQIMPTTIGFPLTLAVLEPAAVAAFECVEVLEPHALSASAAAVTANEYGSQRDSPAWSTNVTLL
jgi:hypothetical protein